MPPVVTGADASAYRDRILAHCADYPKFQPLMTLYLTENTDASDVIAAAEAGIVHAVKLYPREQQPIQRQGFVILIRCALF